MDFGNKNKKTSSSSFANNSTSGMSSRETKNSRERCDLELEQGIPQVVTIFPPEDGELDLTEFEPILCAQQDLENMQNSGSYKTEEVNVIIDDQIEDQVVELLGLHANLGFALEDMTLKYLVMHMKNVSRFFRFEMVVLDRKGEMYTIQASNRQSAVRAKLHSCSLPIKLTPGWNRLCLNLEDICMNAFGVEYHSVISIRVFASCRIWRLFFQGQDYADDELPLHLRVV